ncbi:MAG: hypothetical protein JMDDDDMK_00737 [Acidobacteria bacterium]|nr:hypothetical protein [Acidobacteriota bacterium]
MKRSPKRYSEGEKAVALEALNLAGGNVARAARETGIYVNTLREWAHGRNVSPSIYVDYVAKKKGAVSARLSALQDRLVEALFDEEKIEAARYGELSTAFGIVTDKLRLMDERPTAITEARDDSEIRAKTLALLEDYKAALDGDEAKAKEALLRDAPSLDEYLN